jgi:hypothetical protein
MKKANIPILCDATRIFMISISRDRNLIYEPNLQALKSNVENDRDDWRLQRASYKGNGGGQSRRRKSGRMKDSCQVFFARIKAIRNSLEAPVKMYFSEKFVENRDVTRL